MVAQVSELALKVPDDIGGGIAWTERLVEGRALSNGYLLAISMRRVGLAEFGCACESVS